MLVLQGKCTENSLLPSFDAACFLSLFHYKGGMFGMNLNRINKAISLESIPVYGML